MIDDLHFVHLIQKNMDKGLAEKLNRVFPFPCGFESGINPIYFRVINDK